MNLLKSFSLYTFVGVFSAGVGFLIMPVLTHYLSPADYGIISLINSYVAFLIPFLAFRSTGYILIEKFNKNLKESEFASLFSSVSAFPIFVFLLCSLLCLQFKEVLANLLAIPSKAIILIPILSILSVYAELLSRYLTIEKKAKSYSLINLSKTILEIGLTLMFIIGFGMNWEGRIDSWLITSLLFTIFAFAYFSKNGLLSWIIKSEHIKKGLIYGAPLIFHYLSKIIMNQSDKIFISKMISNEALGVYNSGYQIGSIILILSGAFMNVYNPYVFELLSNKPTLKHKIAIVRIAYIFLITISLVLVALLFAATPFFRWFIDSQYITGSQYVFWVGLGYLFWAIYLIFSAPIFFFKKTKTLGYLALLNVSLNLIFNYIFIKQYGALGAACATALSFFIVSIISIIAASRICKLPWLSFRAIINA